MSDEHRDLLRRACDAAMASLKHTLNEPVTDEQIELALRQVIAMKLGIDIDQVGALHWDGDTVVGVDVVGRGFVQTLECDVHVERSDARRLSRKETSMTEKLTIPPTIGIFVMVCSCGWKFERANDPHCGSIAVDAAKEHRDAHPSAELDWFLAVPRPER